MVLETLAGILATKGLETLASESVKILMETHVKPFVQKEAEWNLKMYEIEECIKEYLEITYKKAMLMNTIVFRGVDKTLCDLYLPLTLERQIYDNKKETLIINDECLDAVNNFEKILIVDTAGMGKSTIVKYLIIKYINENDNIPILIELRKIKENQYILDYIVEQFSLLGSKIDKKDVVIMLRRGDFTIFLDGYDEVSNESKKRIMEDMQAFFSIAGKNRFVLTSREEADLTALGDFKRFSIKPLTIQEAFELIKLYDEDGILAGKLISRIKNDKQLNILKEFLTNPMLTSLLYKTFQYKEEIAYKKLDFYGQVYEALFNDHDKTKGGAYVHEKKSLLDSTDFERLMRRIAFLSLKNNKVEYSNKAEVVQIIQEAINKMPWINTKAENVLYDLTHAVPFFQKDGIAYKWVHKSFMEYFSAAFICYESDITRRLFKQMAESTSFTYYTNVLDFCLEMKPEIFREVVIYPFLCDYVNHCESFYNKYADYDLEVIEMLKTASFVSKARIHVYDTEEECDDNFRGIRNKDVLFSQEDIGKVQMISRYPNERILCAFSMKKKKKLFEFLISKNVEIFYDMTSNNREKQKLFYKNVTEKVYIVNDKINQWYNSIENSRIFSEMWMDALTTFEGKKAKVMSYNKCLELKEKISREIEMQKQIDMDLE